MSTKYPHTAKSVFFGCIDDRLTQADSKFIADHGEAFHPNLAGGGAAFIDTAERTVALKQIVAAYQINNATEIYIESHTDCGAYRLAGITFSSPDAEIARLYADLDLAAKYVTTALTAAGADPSRVTVHTRVVDPTGKLQTRRNTPALAAI